MRREIQYIGTDQALIYTVFEKVGLSPAEYYGPNINQIRAESAMAPNMLDPIWSAAGGLERPVLLF
jgi:hypothetical protein